MSSFPVTIESEVSGDKHLPAREDPSLELQKPKPKGFFRPKGEDPGIDEIRRKAGFQPGNGGPMALRNPKPLSSKMKQFLQEPYRGPSKTYKARNFTQADALAANLLKQALDGDMRSFELLIDRVEGKLATATAVTGAGGGPLEISALTPDEKKARVAELLAMAAVEEIEQRVQDAEDAKA
jgi:hypothetical protein